MGHVHCRRQCVEAHSADLSSAGTHAHFSVAWMALCFALHCHCSLVSVRSVTVSLSTWKEMYAALVA